jgi:hypothetical protein
MNESHSARNIENRFLVKKGILCSYISSMTFPKRCPKNQEPRTIPPPEVLDKKFKKIIKKKKGGKKIKIKIFLNFL